MAPRQALELLDRLVASMQITRVEHQQAAVAIQALAKLIDTAASKPTLSAVEVKD